MFILRPAGIFRARDNFHTEEGSRPVSRVLSRTIIHLGCASPRTSSGLPGNSAGRAIVPLFGLAPSGVCPATAVASRAVRSYRTISPLPLSGRYIFCGTFRRLAPPRHYLASRPMEPGLSSLSAMTAERATAWPTPLPLYFILHRAGRLRAHTSGHGHHQTSDP